MFNKDDCLCGQIMLSLYSNTIMLSIQFVDLIVNVPLCADVNNKESSQRKRFDRY